MPKYAETKRSCRAACVSILARWRLTLVLARMSDYSCRLNRSFASRSLYSHFRPQHGIPKTATKVSSAAIAAPSTININGAPKVAVVSLRSVKNQSFSFLSGAGFLSGLGLLTDDTSLNDGNDNIALIDSVLISNRVRNSQVKKDDARRQLSAFHFTSN